MAIMILRSSIVYDGSMLRFGFKFKISILIMHTIGYFVSAIIIFGIIVQGLLCAINETPVFTY